MSSHSSGHERMKTSYKQNAPLWLSWGYSFGSSCCILSRITYASGFLYLELRRPERDYLFISSAEIKETCSQVTCNLLRTCSWCGASFVSSVVMQPHNKLMRSTLFHKTVELRRHVMYHAAAHQWCWFVHENVAWIFFTYGSFSSKYCFNALAPSGSHMYHLL